MVREEIRVKHSVELPEPLIQRLSEFPALPDEWLTKFEEKDVTSKPSDIAHLHAAWLCGAPILVLSTRQLQNYTGDAGRRSFKKAVGQAKQKALGLIRDGEIQTSSMNFVKKLLNR